MSDAPGLAVAMPSETERWDNWRQKGRADDVRFRHRFKMVLIDVAATLALGGAIWFAFQS